MGSAPEGAPPEPAAAGRLPRPRPRPLPLETGGSIDMGGRSPDWLAGLRTGEAVGTPAKMSASGSSAACAAGLLLLLPGVYPSPGGYTLPLPLDAGAGLAGGSAPAPSPG